EQLKPRATLLLSRAVQKKISQADITMFFRQISTMITANIPLVQALEFVANGIESLKMKNLIMTLHFYVSSGETFADALSKYPKYFNNLVSSLIRVGEQSGTLETILEQIATYLERLAVLKGRIKKAMYYPVIMITVMLLLAVLLLGFIVPKFKDMFASFGAELPAPTLFVLNLSYALQNYWWLILIIVGVIFVAFILLKRKSPKFRKQLAKLSIKVALFGSLIQKAIIARVTRTLSITLAAGIPLVEALNCATNVAGNIIYADSIAQIRDKIIKGADMNAAMRNDPLFPAIVIQMISVGEKSGSMETILLKIANYYDEQVDTQVEALSTLIEPLMLILIGLLVGGFVVSMYLPIFKIGTLL
ncbi:MAG: type II secretion system F family protein, partial [Gammaproteobacteria bacterium]|nr:type II secretion system F family protein [Gammaproteobacteria bacterium]